MKKLGLVPLVVLLLAGVALGQAADPPEPPGKVTATDRPHDKGEVAIVEWELSPTDDGEREDFLGYLVERRILPDGEWDAVSKVDRLGVPAIGAGTREFLDRRVPKGAEVEYRVVAIAAAARSAPSAVSNVTPALRDLFFGGAYPNFMAIWIFGGILLGWIWAAAQKLSVPWALGFLLLTVFFAATMVADGMGLAYAALPFVAPIIAIGLPLAKRGSEIYIRPIPALQAVEEAIGRATEMGKPILFVPGISTIEDVATIASLNILSPVAEKAAQYDSKLIVPNYDPIVYTITQEVVKEAYTKAGRPDAYSDENVFYLTARQFAYAAAVNGIMMRERPATNFFLGMFFAESLLLAETGNMTGAVQIAGTDAVTQLPFFIVACDYTLIGEELYAAGAYMGDDPKLTGSLKGQDWNKALVIVIYIVFAVGALIYGLVSNPNEWSANVKNLPKTLFESEQ